MSKNIMEILVIFVLILLNGVFALAEIAFVSSSENKLKEIVQRNKKAKIVLDLKKDPDRFLSTIQVGITIIGIISGAVSGATLADDLSRLLVNIPYISQFSYQISFATLVLTITYFSIVLGELIPKTFGMKDPEFYILKLIGFIKIFSIIMFPFVFILTFSVKLFFKVLGIKTIDENEMDLIKQISGVTKVALIENKMEKEQVKIIKNTIKINKIIISEIMVPKKDIKYLYSDMSLMDALIEAHLHQHTRYLIYDKNQNKTIGYVNFKDIINVMKFDPENPTLMSICRPILHINEQEYLIGALKKMTKKFQHIALIVDIQNNEIGLISMEDIMETIVGDINDEFDFIPDYLYKIAINRFIAGGKVKMSKIHDEISNKMPDVGESINDWLADQFDGNLKTDGKIKVEDVTFIIKKINRSKIYEVIIELPSPSSV